MKTEGVEALPISKRVTLLRGVCNERLKNDIEYALKRGTTDNSYLIQVLPEYGALFVLCLFSQREPSSGLISLHLARSVSSCCCRMARSISLLTCQTRILQMTMVRHLARDRGR